MCDEEADGNYSTCAMRERTDFDQENDLVQLIPTRCFMSLNLVIPAHTKKARPCAGHCGIKVKMIQMAETSRRELHNRPTGDCGMKLNIIEKFETSRKDFQEATKVCFNPQFQVKKSLGQKISFSFVGSWDILKCPLLPRIRIFIFCEVSWLGKFCIISFPSSGVFIP